VALLLAPSVRQRVPSLSITLTDRHRNQTAQQESRKTQQLRPEAREVGPERDAGVLAAAVVRHNRRVLHGHVLLKDLLVIGLASGVLTSGRR
jgi:hypothetical protein